MNVEVIYALPDRYLLLDVELPAGATVRDAIEQSEILRQCPEIDLTRHKVGVFGQLRGLDAALAAGDRVEIYRPLPADPKEMRRRRAAR